ncbi:MAG: HAMP domain-containing histidine kinase, partial [Boseongicola sp.]|nr:HAMP domain-containing histidine kinase [Boseongicola sp.]
VKQGMQGFLPEVTPDFMERLERELAGSVGAATAHAMIAQITGGASVTVEDLIRVADEAQQILEYSNRLEAKSAEQERTARQLREANEKLLALSVQKDGFLSQISHELRTPMTSIRSFSEILMADETMQADDRLRYSRIIHDETKRLTRLLDDLLDLSVLENGQVTLNMEEETLSAVLDRAIAAMEVATGQQDFAIERSGEGEDIRLYTDGDRLSQVFINLIANALKYCESPSPRLTIKTGEAAGRRVVDFLDNGKGIPVDAQALIFEKFARVSDNHAAGGAGLGLAICREVMTRLGGGIVYLPGQGGAAFRVILPEARAKAA